MKRAFAVSFLGLIVIGLLLMLYGTRTTYTTVTGGIHCEGSFSVICSEPVVTLYNLTYNYIGGLLAILGAIGFGATYPLAARRLTAP